MEYSVGLIGEGPIYHILESAIASAIPFYKLSSKPNKQGGCKSAGKIRSAQELAVCSDVIFICCQSVADLENIILGIDGIVSAKKRLFVVDMSDAISPEFAREISEQLTELNCSYLDALMIETDSENDYSRVMLVGADHWDFNKVEPLLSKICSNLKLIGAVGATKFYRQAFLVRGKCF